MTASAEHEALDVGERVVATRATGALRLEPPRGPGNTLRRRRLNASERDAIGSGGVLSGDPGAPRGATP